MVYFNSLLTVAKIIITQSTIKLTIKILEQGVKDVTCKK